MRVLIDGAAGFLGRWFMQHHLAAGDDVLALDDMSNPLSHWLEAANHLDCIEMYNGTRLTCLKCGRTVIEGDPLRNAASLGIDAAFFRWAVDHVDTVVYPSSSAVYGTMWQRDSTVRALREDLFHPKYDTWDAPDAIYGTTKLVGEVLAWNAARYGLNTLCIRPFSGYGADQGLDYPVPSIAQRVARHEIPLTIWGSGQQTRDFIEVQDVVGATVARLDAGVKGWAAMNIGSGIATTFGRIAELLVREERGYHPEIVTDESKPQGVMTRYADTTEMRRYYTPRIPLVDGLRRVLYYQRSQQPVAVE